MKLSYSLLHFIMSYSKVYYSVLARIYNGQWCVEISVDWLALLGKDERCTYFKCITAAWNTYATNIEYHIA